MGKKLKPVPKGNKGLGKLPTEVRNKMGFMAVGGPVRQTIEVKSIGDTPTGPKGYRQKKSETFYRDKFTKGKFVNIKDKQRKKKGGIVKGGTSSQMTGKEFKGIF